MIRVYGMEICPDCLEAKEQLLLAGIDFEFWILQIPRQISKNF